MPRVSSDYEKARRGQIIAAAAESFSRGGFAATSVPGIASRAGLSVGAIYRYFSSKEDLFLAVVEERVAVYNQAVFAELSSLAPPPVRLRSALHSLQRLLLTQTPEEARLSLELWARAHDVEQLRRWLREARQRRTEAFSSVIREAQECGDFCSEMKVADAASALMALADGLVVRRACDPFLESAGNPLVEADKLLSSWRPVSAGVDVPSPG